MCLTDDTLPYAGPAPPTVVRVTGSWDDAATGVVALPSGWRVRGRAWADVLPGPRPDLGIYLLPRPPAATPWDSRWVRWRDFSLPADPALLRETLAEALTRAAAERVEIACRGGTGRTGTALACLAALDGLPPDEAVDYVRARYRPRAVETKAQAALVRGWSGPASGTRPERSEGWGDAGSFFSRG